MSEPAEFQPAAVYSETIEQIPPDPRTRLTAAIVATGRGQADRPGAVATRLLIVAPDAATVDAWPSGDQTAGHPGFTALPPTSVYLNEVAARILRVDQDDRIALYLGARPTQVQVRAILLADQLTRPEPTAYLTLNAAQVLLGRPDQINAILAAPVTSAELAILPLPSDPATLIAQLTR